MDGNGNVIAGKQLDPNPGGPFSFQNHPQCPLGGGRCGGSGRKSRAKSFCHLYAHL
jgi:hypothetical protein